MAGAEHPKVFYHGSQTAIHRLSEPLLDPRFAAGGDDGDPKAPHVFVTPHRVMASIYALKTPDVIAIGAEKDHAVIIFSRLPRNLHGGWLYTCPENPERPFREMIIGGRRTGGWVSFDKVPVAKPEFIPGLKTLADQDRVQVYVLKAGIDIRIWLDKHRNAAYTGQLASFIHQQLIVVGNLYYLNIK